MRDSESPFRINSFSVHPELPSKGAMDDHLISENRGFVHDPSRVSVPGQNGNVDSGVQPHDFSNILCQTISESSRIRQYSSETVRFLQSVRVEVRLSARFDFRLQTRRSRYGHHPYLPFFFIHGLLGNEDRFAAEASGIRASPGSLSGAARYEGLRRRPPPLCAPFQPVVHVGSSPKPSGKTKSDEDEQSSNPDEQGPLLWGLFLSRRLTPNAPFAATDLLPVFELVVFFYEEPMRLALSFFSPIKEFTDDGTESNIFILGSQSSLSSSIS